MFFLNSFLLGIGLAMDAFSVSLANGLTEPKMSRKKMCIVAGDYGFFQALMPMIGWSCVHAALEHFRTIEKWIPWIAMLLLFYIGGSMIIEGIGERQDSTEQKELGALVLLMQGIATSIDALSVGFTIASYGFWMALTCSFIIAVTTFCISLIGLYMGKRFGIRFSKYATVLGGSILMIIGVEILVKSLIHMG